jgi:hypothetical protein
MLPLLGFHALAATRGEGLRPELLALLERLAAAAEPVANGPGRPADGAGESKSVRSREFESRTRSADSPVRR